MLISPCLRVSYASHPTRCLIFKSTARMIADRAPRLYSEMASHRILYAGDDIHLPDRLRSGLKWLDCFLMHSPVLTARTLIRSDIEYSLLLFDKTAAGAELESYARTLPHREHTPVLIVKKSEGSGGLLEAIRRCLGKG
jgi:hypothetical protein